jgi:hypothetical protein
VITEERITRAAVVQPSRPRVRVTASTPLLLPGSAASRLPSTIAPSRNGTPSMTSTKRESSASSQPPKYPADSPTARPMTPAIRTLQTPTTIE